jgi:hypothetical protein
VVDQRSGRRRYRWRLPTHGLPPVTSLLLDKPVLSAAPLRPGLSRLPQSRDAGSGTNTILDGGLVMFGW